MDIEQMKFNLHLVREKITESAEKVGRDPSEITLIAVSKTMPPEYVSMAIESGVTNFGENYLQDGEQKASMFANSATWHFIGNLQRNKVGKVIDLFHMIQSVDSLSLAERIGRLAKERDIVVPILLQIHYGDEVTKHGLLPDELDVAYEQISTISNISVKGLMTIPPLVNSPEENRCYFRNLYERANALNLPSKPIISMGMTDDFDIAIEEGATMVRVGRAIFGERRRK